MKQRQRRQLDRVTLSKADKFFRRMLKHSTPGRKMFWGDMWREYCYLYNNGKALQP
jgi:hypothetical protein